MLLWRLSMVAGARTSLWKKVSQRGRLEALADALAKQAVQVVGDKGELQVELDAQRHGAGDGVDVEEVGGVGDGVLDHRAACVAVDQAGGVRLELVGQPEGGVFVAEVGDGELPDGPGIPAQPDEGAEAARRAIAPAARILIAV